MPLRRRLLGSGSRAVAGGLVVGALVLAHSQGVDAATNPIPEPVAVPGSLPPSGPPLQTPTAPANLPYPSIWGSPDGQSIPSAGLGVASTAPSTSASAAPSSHRHGVQVLSVSPGRWIAELNAIGNEPSGTPTDNVVVRLPSGLRTWYSCSVTLRRLGRIVGRSDTTAVVEPSAVSLVVELTTKKPFSGPPSDAQVRCS